MLEAKVIHKVYNDGKKDLAVLKGIDLKIEEGRFAAIVGPSGAGKSTLLHILGGLDSPTQGKVFFQSKDIYNLSDPGLAKIRNQKIGFVFQFYHLLSEFTVLENVMIPALISAQSTSHSLQFREKAMELLIQMGLSERVSHFPNQLSGGEKQRVAIARALINNPCLLLCDEPTGNLDSKSGEDIISLIKNISLKNQMTVVLVTHNLELSKLADKVYYLRDGILIN
ncbi:MAG: ABC transporter ATP-binding protein [Candidatus Omnitrophica bacterium]|nr:ABC transporter ATP-binding protein [Candidatus Omnitrophota bacterium]